MGAASLGPGREAARQKVGMRRAWSLRCGFLLSGLVLLWQASVGFMIPTAPPRPRGKTPEQRGLNDWHVKVAHAVDVLQDDVPELFFSYGGMGGRLPDFSIYSPEISFVDERAPGFELKGLNTYKRFLSALRWSVQSMSEESKLEITAMSKVLEAQQLRLRWRLHLWPKGLVGHAMALFAPGLQQTHYSEAPVIIEGYSKYEFDPWSGEVTKHSVDIKNPPMFLTDLFRQYSQAKATPYPSLRTESRTTLAGATLPLHSGQSERVALKSGLKEWMPSMPESCEDDFDCNGGAANFPLQCCELPLIGKFCCKPPDDDPAPNSRDPDLAWVPLPVPNEPWRGY
ncbi:unnamed protein product [Effrenium voratum]|nr:unnamed protein product [Effrenium voratum]